MKDSSIAMTGSPQKSFTKLLLSLPVMVAALGYMVDMYDLFLFSIVRVPSLKSLNISGGELLEDGIMLLNLQMAGMLTGGIVWGILGDKKGRLSVLFAFWSIWLSGGPFSKGQEPRLDSRTVSRVRRVG